MESGLPTLNCLVQHTLRSLCSDSSTPPKWVYAVFWKILPRNYPPPKWDHGGGLLDRAKGNKRNWILVWEDGFCDFCECERAGRFGADIFFKMTHEVYNFGEGLVGKVASDNSHRWVFRDSPTENDPTSISSWNVSIDPQPRAWEGQFSSGIETIAVISVREGAIQLGSFDKVVEDLNTVVSIQRKFNYLQSFPGICAIQRPYLSIHNTNTLDYNNNRLMQTTIGSKRQQQYDQLDDDSPTKSIYLGYNSPHSCAINGSMPPVWSIPPLMPSMTGNIGTFFSKMPSVPLPYCAPEWIDHENVLINLKSGPSRNFDEISTVDVKMEISGEAEVKGSPLRLEDGVMDLGYESRKRGKKWSKFD